MVINSLKGVFKRYSVVNNAFKDVLIFFKKKKYTFRTV